jgi:uncharacterized SAM-binding protein YcdF (DUF218 family)
MLLFSLKKLIGILLTPLNITLLLLLVSIIILKYKPKLGQRFLVVGFLVLLLSSTPIVSNQLVKSIDEEIPMFEKQQEYVDYIVVLGCSHTTNHRLPVIAQLKTCSLERLMESHRIFLLHPEAILITSGHAFTDEVSNAQKVKEAAISIGIPADKIIIEERPKDTREEAEFLSPLLINKRFVLVTNAIHMPRAYRYFKMQNLSPLLAPTNLLYKGESSEILLNLPNVSTLEKTTRTLYELLGRIAQWFTS